MTWGDMVMLYIVMTSSCLACVIICDSRVYHRIWWWIIPKAKISLPRLHIEPFGHGGSISYEMQDTYRAWLDEHVGRKGWAWDWDLPMHSLYFVSDRSGNNISDHHGRLEVVIRAPWFKRQQLTWLQLTYA